MNLVFAMIIQTLIIMLFLKYKRKLKYQTNFIATDQSNYDFGGSNEFFDSQPFSIEEAIKLVNDFLGENKLSKMNTRFSIINTSKSIWEVRLRSLDFKEDLHLLLVKETGFIWLEIPKNTCEEPHLLFRIIENNGLVDLTISNESGYYNLRDINFGGCGYDFNPHFKQVFE